MGVCLILATRGRQSQLIGNLTLTMLNATRADTQVVVVCDDDDLAVPHASFMDNSFMDNSFWFMPRVKFIRVPRPDTLGAKYNLGYEQAPSADLYVPFVDTVHIMTPGWDDRLLKAAMKFKDRLGTVYFGKQFAPLTLPEMIGVTRKFVEVQGYFMPPYFPFWWHDTWTHEVSQLTRRVTHADVKISPSQAGKQTRGAQEIVFWGTAYRDLHIERLQIAREMIMASDYPDWQKEEIDRDMPFWMETLIDRESTTTRNEKWAADFELRHSADVHKDDRYKRTKKAMLEKLCMIGAIPKDKLGAALSAVNALRESGDYGNYHEMPKPVVASDALQRAGWA